MEGGPEHSTILYQIHVQQTRVVQVMSFKHLFLLSNNITLGERERERLREVCNKRGVAPLLRKNPGQGNAHKNRMMRVGWEWILPPNFLAPWHSKAFCSFHPSFLNRAYSSQQSREYQSEKTLKNKFAKLQFYKKQKPKNLYFC